MDKTKLHNKYNFLPPSEEDKYVIYTDDYIYVQRCKDIQEAINSVIVLNKHNANHGHKTRHQYDRK